MSKINAAETVKVSQELYRYPTVFEDYIISAQNFPFSKVFSRLVHWLDFFNNSFHTSHCVHYHCTIEALLEVWLNSKVLSEQSAYEFELSKQFYESFFEYAKGAVFVDPVATKKLLVLSYVFSKYHGMIQKSILNQFGNHNGVISCSLIDEIFENSFVKYESPKFLISNIEEMTAEEIQLTMEAIQGRNLRSHSIFHEGLSKHEFAKLNALEISHLKYKNNIVLRGSIIVRLTNISFNENLMQVFLRASGTFMMNPNKYSQDLGYWKKGYELIMDGIRGPETCTITDCVDFLEHKKYQCEEPFSLKGRTTNSFLRLVADWHGYVSRLNFDHFRKESWDKSKMLDLHFTFEKKSYNCKELHTGNLLYKEGQELNHCVITYTPQCKNRLCTIWSLKERVEPSETFTPILTLEVADNKIIQARGLDDRLPNKHEYKVINDWAERMSLEIELIKNE